MAIVATDLKFYLSGGSSNPDPLLSLGGAISSVQASSNLLDDISTAESASGDTEYRAIFVKNTNSTDTAYSVKVWIASNTPSAATEIRIGLAGEGVANTIETIGNESTAPSGASFSTADGESNALTIGNLTAGQAHGVWIRRTVSTTSTPFSNDGATIRVRANTAA